MATSILEWSPDRSAEVSAEVEDLRLVESLREGNQQAYEELIARFQQPVYTLALRLLNNQSEACDVVQEVFLKVFRRVNSFREHSSLRTWMYRIAVNEAHNHHRWFNRHCRREVTMEDAAQRSAALESAAHPGSWS